VKRGDWITHGLIAMAAAGALGAPVPIFGQGQDAPAPAQDWELVKALSERVRALEEAAGQDTAGEIDASTAVLATVALAELANYVARTLWARTRPVLAWSPFDDGSKFSLREIQGGAKCLAVRITNVGQAAAIDIVGRAGVTFSAKRAGARLDPRQHHVGSLHPGASAQVLVPLSDAEHRRAMGGEPMTFRLLLRYGAMRGRRYTYDVSGMRSGSLSVLVGVVGKPLPARERRGLYGARPARARARARGQPLNAQAGGGRP